MAKSKSVECQAYSLLNQISDQMAEAQDDVVKFEKGNKAAGRRIRKNMQNIKKLAQEVRVDISNAVKEM